MDGQGENSHCQNATQNPMKPFDINYFRLCQLRAQTPINLDSVLPSYEEVFQLHNSTGPHTARAATSGSSAVAARQLDDLNALQQRELYLFEEMTSGKSKWKKFSSNLNGTRISVASNGDYKGLKTNKLKSIDDSVQTVNPNQSKEPKGVYRRICESDYDHHYYCVSPTEYYYYAEHWKPNSISHDANGQAIGQEGQESKGVTQVGDELTKLNNIEKSYNQVPINAKQNADTALENSLDGNRSQAAKLSLSSELSPSTKKRDKRIRRKLNKKAQPKPIINVHDNQIKQQICNNQVKNCAQTKAPEKELIENKNQKPQPPSNQTKNKNKAKLESMQNNESQVKTCDKSQSTTGKALNGKQTTNLKVQHHPQISNASHWISHNPRVTDSFEICDGTIDMNICGKLIMTMKTTYRESPPPDNNNNNNNNNNNSNNKSGAKTTPQNPTRIYSSKMSKQILHGKVKFEIREGKVRIELLRKEKKAKASCNNANENKNKQAEVGKKRKNQTPESGKKQLGVTKKLMKTASEPANKRIKATPPQVS